MNSRQIVFPLSLVLPVASSVSGQSLPVTYQPVDVAGSSAQDTSEAPEHPVSKREIRAMIPNAKTAQDHQAIADYFAQQADLLEKKSSEHEARCALIAEHPMNYKTNAGLSVLPANRKLLRKFRIADKPPRTLLMSDSS